MNGTHLACVGLQNEAFRECFDRAVKKFNQGKNLASLELFTDAGKHAQTKEEFLLSHIFKIWAKFRSAPYSTPCDHSLNLINIAINSTLQLVEECRLRAVCEILRHSSYSDWCLDAHKRLWNAYQNFLDGVAYLDVLTDMCDYKSGEELLYTLEENLALKKEHEAKPFFLAVYRYCLKVGDLNRAVGSLESVVQILGETPEWIERELHRVSNMQKNKLDVYYEILKGNKDVVGKLDFNDISNSASSDQAMVDISASVVFDSRDELFKKLDHYINTLPVQQCLPVLKFAMAYLPKDRLKGIELPNNYGFIDLALLKYDTRKQFLNWLDRCPKNPHGFTLELVKAITSAPKYLGGKDLVSFNGDSSIFRFKSNKVLVIGFCGLHGDMFVPMTTFSYFFESRSDVSQLWLNDVSASNYAKGIPGFGRNVIEMSVKLKAIIEEYKFEKVVCIGNSAGGGAAAFFSWHLGADEVIGLSAPTFVDLQNTDRNPSALFKGFIEKGINLSIDLRNFYRSKTAPKLTLYYGDANPVDVEYAKNMDGLPNVHLKPLAGESSHSIVPNLVVSGELQRLIKAL